MATADRLLAWHLCRQLASEGVAWAAELAPADVPPPAGTRMTWGSLCGLWDRALDEVRQPELLPLRVAAGVAPGAHASPLTHYSRAAPSIEQAVERIVTGWSAVTDTFAWALQRRPAGPLLVAGPAPLGTAGERALLAFVLVDAVRTGHQMSAGRWSPRLVRLPFDVGALPPWERAVRCPVEAPATHLAIAFHRRDLALRPVQADPSLSRILRPTMEQLAAGPDAPDLAEQVRAEIRVQLQSGPPRLDATARMVGRSPRSLHRHLAELGTSYRALCDEVRYALATELLPTLPPDEVAARLGFAELRPFQRAFKRWSGTTVRDFLDG